MAQWKRRAGGCSSPILRDSLNAMFRDACNLHDLCYASLNASRDDCDSSFRWNMLQTCSLQDRVNKSLCRSIAIVMYRAVRLFGQLSFNNGQKWANRNCRSWF